MPDEYISREAALKYIKSEQCKTCSDIGLCGNCAVLVAVKLLEKVPAADVAPVVRCRDCKYGSYDSKPNGAMVCLRTNDGFWRKEADFCSYGEYQTNAGGVTNKFKSRLAPIMPLGI